MRRKPALCERAGLFWCDCTICRLSIVVTYMSSFVKLASSNYEDIIATCKRMMRTSRLRGGYFFLFCPLRKRSRAVVIDGASGDGASTSRRKPASRIALAVVGPKHPIFISFCSKLGKFFINDAIPEGLKNTSIS